MVDHLTDDELRDLIAKIDDIRYVRVSNTDLVGRALRELEQRRAGVVPVQMLLWCPECGTRHVDMGEFATKVHHTHACQFCGHVWRPAVVPTVGMMFLPGFKNGGDRG